MEDPATPPKKPVETAYKDTEEAKVVSFAATINEDIHRKVMQKLKMYADRYEEPCMTLQYRTEGHAETRCTEIKCAWGQTVKIMQECVVCRDFIDYQHWFCLPCRDIICQPCIYTLFERAAAKESDHPPQCGGIKINMDWFLKNDLDKTDIGKNLLACFREKIEEYSTIDRTYCAVPTCSAFIKPDPIFPDKFALCTSCQSRTCIKCKHLKDSPECCVSTDFHETAKSMKWRKCQHCNTWIERDDGGCNRMMYVFLSALTIMYPVYNTKI